TMPAMTLRWTDRHFHFELPEEMFPVVVERLRGTPARIEDKVRGLSPAVLTRREGDAWSIQEHIGHLLDLDELHTGRLDDYLAGVEILRAADMTNRKTWEADHNGRAIEELLRDFRRERERFVARLDAWDPSLISLTALHPRLNQPMRVIDMALFTAEHDDHHLTKMTELARRRDL
ncbi:MAG TPA: DinB family protein, partial [Thermoanaerobaculia bacterium]|nr:DinB family protein [Thermoanaerobaculia bacterium]